MKLNKTWLALLLLLNVIVAGALTDLVRSFSKEIFDEQRFNSALQETIITMRAGVQCYTIADKTLDQKVINLSSKTALLLSMENVEIGNSKLYTSDGGSDIGLLMIQGHYVNFSNNYLQFTSSTTGATGLQVEEK